MENMRKMKRTILPSLATMFFLLGGFYVREAHAYLDPGTGSYVFQLIVAGIIGGTLVLRMGWGRIVFFLKRIFSRKNRI